MATNLTANAIRDHKGNIVRIREFDVAASVTIYAGAIVHIDSAGYARPVAVTSSNNSSSKGVCGIAKTKVDNSSGSAQDKQVDVMMGTFRLPATSVEQSKMGDIMYAIGDAEVDETQSVSGPICGTLEKRESATDVWVYIDFSNNKALSGV